MNHQMLVMDFTDDAKITDAIAPKSGQLAMQWFAEMARIAGTFKAGLQPVKDTSRSRTVELGELLLRKRRDFNRPGQALS